MLVIVDYGMSNLRSVSKALEVWQVGTKISGDPADLENADRVILPGVGAFGEAMAELAERGLIEPLREWVRRGKPFLGICLGLQLLFDSSEESPGVSGLGILPGKIARFAVSGSFKVPHMGWNQIRLKKPGCPLVAGVKDGSYVYFVHSYYAVPAGPEVVLAETDYASTFPAMVWRDNVYGTQFHPEKSQETGLRILENFVRLSPGGSP